MKHRTYWTMKDCCETWGCSERSIRRWIARGELKARRFGRSFRILEADAIKFEDSRVVAPK